VYDCASITKSVVTATLAHQLLDEGRISLDTRLIEHVPEYAARWRDEITVWHLLTHTVGGYALSQWKEKSAKEIEQLVMTTDFAWRPGERYAYGNVSSLLLGLLLERVLGKSLLDSARTCIFKPYDMKQSSMISTSYSCAPAEIVDSTEVCGVVHDESARMFARERRAVGHAGLLSTADDLLTFAEAFMKGEIVSNGIISVLQKNQIEHLGSSTGLGWELHQEWMGNYTNAIGKTGFTGTSILIDRAQQKACVILSNRTYPRRPTDSRTITAFRKAVHCSF